MSAVQEKVSAANCWHPAGKELKEMRFHLWGRFQKTKLKQKLPFTRGNWKMKKINSTLKTPQLTTLIDNATILPAEMPSVCDLLVKHEVKGPLQSKEDLNKKKPDLFFLNYFIFSVLALFWDLPAFPCVYMECMRREESNSRTPGEDQSTHQRQETWHSLKVGAGVNLAFNIKVTLLVAVLTRAEQ